MTLVLIGKDLVLGGLTSKNRGHLGSRIGYHIPCFMHGASAIISDNRLESGATTSCVVQ